MHLIGRSALAHDAAFTMAEIEVYADQFADNVPEDIFTPADIQNFLQGCRSDPLKALREIDAWVVQNRDKPDFANVPRSNEASAPNSLDLDSALLESALLDPSLVEELDFD